MPAPLAAALAAVLARGGTAVAARVGASAATSAASGAATAAGTGAAEGTVIQGMRSSVHGVTRSLAGGAEQTAKTVQAIPSPPPPGSNVLGTPPTSPTQWKQPTPRPKGYVPPAPKGFPIKPSPTPAPSPPKTFGTLFKEQISGGAKKFSDNLKGLNAENIKQAMFKGYNRPQPYQGTLEERSAAMRQSGELLSPKQVTQRTGIKKPELSHIVQESEDERQRKHDEAREKSAAALKSTAKTGMTAAMVPGLTVALAPLIATKTISGLKQFSEGIFDAQKGLARYNEKIATVTALHERQSHVLALRTAGATSGSTAMLGRSVMGMREEMQSLKELGTSVKNFIAIGAAKFATIALWVINRHPLLALIKKGVSSLEEIAGSKKGEGIAFDKFIKDIASGDWESGVGAKRPPITPSRDPGRFPGVVP